MLRAFFSFPKVTSSWHPFKYSAVQVFCHLVSSRCDAVETLARFTSSISQQKSRRAGVNWTFVISKPPPAVHKLKPEHSSNAQPPRCSEWPLLPSLCRDQKLNANALALSFPKFCPLELQRNTLRIHITLDVQPRAGLRCGADRTANSNYSKCQRPVSGT